MPRSAQFPTFAATAAVHSSLWDFDYPTVYDAPPTSGVYALWRYGQVIFYGCASGGDSTIRWCIAEHLVGLRGEATRRASHWSCEICANPEARHMELLSTYWANFGRVPACNTDFAARQIIRPGADAHVPEAGAK